MRCGLFFFFKSRCVIILPDIQRFILSKQSQIRQTWLLCSSHNPSLRASLRRTGGAEASWACEKRVIANKRQSRLSSLGRMIHAVPINIGSLGAVSFHTLFFFFSTRFSSQTLNSVPAPLAEGTVSSVCKE